MLIRQFMTRQRMGVLITSFMIFFLAAWVTLTRQTSSRSVGRMAVGATLFGFLGADLSGILLWDRLKRPAVKKTVQQWVAIAIAYLVIFSIVGWISKGIAGGVSFGLASLALATVMAWYDRSRE